MLARVSYDYGLGYMCGESIQDPHTLAPGWTKAGIEPSFLSRMGGVAHLTLASDFFRFPL